MKQKTKKFTIWFTTLTTLLILSSIGIAQIFTDEESALEYKNSFNKYPLMLTQANITKISARIDDTLVVFEWKMLINNTRDNTTDEIQGAFTIIKAQKNNGTLINKTLLSETRREFEDYNKTFQPNPMVEYKSHPSGGKVADIIFK